MKKYQTITTFDGKQVQTKTIAGLKTLVRKKETTEGTFKCVCPNGNIHTWEIKFSRIHTHAGYSSRKKGPRVGKGINKNMYIAIKK